MAKRPRSNNIEHRMARNLDILAKFEKYQEEIFPLLQEAIAKGWTPEQMRSHPKIQAMMEARKITIALTDEDPSRALAAAKDIQDRAEGKAKERVETTHKYEKLKDDALDALLMSELDMLKGEDGEPDQQH